MCAGIDEVVQMCGHGNQLGREHSNRTQEREGNKSVGMGYSSAGDLCGGLSGGWQDWGRTGAMGRVMEMLFVLSFG